MSFENLPAVASNEGLTSNFAMGFAALSVLLVCGLLMVFLQRRRRERDGIVTKYVARGDKGLRRRRPGKGY